MQARDPDYAKRVVASFGRQALMKTLGARMLSVEPGRVMIELAVADHISQQHGFVHAGAVAAIADSAAGYAALSLMPPGAGVLTVEFKINLMAPATGERLIATGYVVKPGRTLTVAQAEVDALAADGSRRAVALLTATMMAIEGRDGVAD